MSDDSSMPLQQAAIRNSAILSDQITGDAKTGSKCLQKRNDKFTSFCQFPGMFSAIIASK